MTVLTADVWRAGDFDIDDVVAILPEPSPEDVRAIEFQAKLEAVDLSAVPVMTRDRQIERKKQAALARKLFRQLGLRGISVTTPNYSMAHVVNVQLPRRNDHLFDADGFVVDGDVAREANNAAHRKMEAILARAFPNHVNRSDSMSDYYDFCWSMT